MSHRSFEATLRHDLAHLLSGNSNAWEEFLKNIPEREDYSLESVVDTYISTANEAVKGINDALLERMEGMSLNDIKFEALEASSGSSVRSNSYLASTQHDSVTIVDSFLREDGVRLYPLLQKKQQQGNISLKQALTEIAEAPEFDVNASFRATTFLVGENNTERFYNIKDDPNFRLMMKTILIPFSHLVVSQFHLDKVVPTGDECRKKFVKWFNQNKVFFTYLQAVQERIAECQSNIEKLGGNDAKGDDDKQVVELKHKQANLQSEFDSARKLFLSHFFSMDDPKIGFKSGFSFLLNLKNSVIQNKFQKFRLAYEQADDFKTKPEEMHENLCSVFGVNFVSLKKRIELPKHLSSVELKLREIDRTLYLISLKAEELFDKGWHSQSFALLRVAENLRTKLDELVDDLSRDAAVSQDDVKGADDEKVVSKADESKATEASLSAYQQCKMNEFLNHSKTVFNNALKSEVLKQHRNLFSRLFSKVYEFFCEIIHSTKRFNPDRVKMLEGCSAKLAAFSDMFKQAEVPLTVSVEESAVSSSPNPK